MSKIHYTYCRNCTAECGLKVEVEGNKILSISGDRQHPFSRGYFCIKGQTTKDFQNGEDRQTTARKGRGADQVDIPVRQALDEISERLKYTIEKYGPGSVGIYYGTGANYNALAHSSLKAGLHMLGSPYIFSSMTIDQSAKWIAMARMGYFAAGQHSLDDADVAMLVGMNPVITHAGGGVVHSQNPARIFREAKARGAQIIVVDPRLTETAKHADLHLQIRPGEDAVLFAGLIRLVLQRGWQNQDFCSRFVTSLDVLDAAVAPFGLEYVEKRTGVPAKQIEAAAYLFSHARKPSAATGTGPNMSLKSNLSEHMVRVFNTLCGGYRRAGDLVRNPGYLFGPRPFIEKVVPPNRTWERVPMLRTHKIGRLFGEFPSALIPDEINGNGKDRLRALIVVGGNPAIALVDPTKSLAALDNLDLLVTLDSRCTETTERSDYVVPTTLPYERFDLTAMFDHYNPVAYARIATPFIQAPTGVINDWEFFWEIAHRMGRQLELKRPMFGVAHEDIPGPTLKLDMNIKPDSESIVRWISSSFGSARYEDLLACEHGDLREDLFTTVQTAPDDGARFDLMPFDVAQELRSAINAHAYEGYKYRLTVRRLLSTMNSAYRNAAKTQLRHPLNPAYMNPEDILEEGINVGDPVIISSQHGSIVAYPQADKGLRRGVISMTHLWGSLDPDADPDGKNGGLTGRLVSLDEQLETINFMPLQSAIPVNINVRTVSANSSCE